ncbi:MAG: response regulator [Fibrobacter sp.]|nr:response regulator [Fibrobacter sp.]
MNKEVTILITEDDEGHAMLIQKNLRRAGVTNPLIHFRDGQEILDFLFRRSPNSLDASKSYLLLLDIRMPRVDGIEVLRQVKADSMLKRIPVIMITTTDDPEEVNQCHALGCNNYIIKPVDYARFVEAIRQLGFFFSIVEIPSLED